MKMSNTRNDHEREIEPDMSSVDVTNENTNNQNDLDNIPMFSPPSTSVSNTLFNSGNPSHFVRLDPQLHAELNKRVKIESNVRQPQKSSNETLEIVQSIFPGVFIYVS